MTLEEEKKVAIADIVYGIAGALVTGMINNKISYNNPLPNLNLHYLHYLMYNSLIHSFIHSFMNFWLLHTLTATGYYRVTQYGKGWEFYAHEPIFWVKLFLFSIIGASSLFPTVKIIQRAVHAANYKNGKRPDPPLPMSEKLANRMIKIINGELLALLSVPLAASLMSRGVLYADQLPWQVGAAPVGLALTGFGYKYVSEAINWKEDE